MDDELPLSLIMNMKKTEINIFLDLIKEAGLLNEFIEFTTDESTFNFQKWEDYFTEFAKKYPKKFHITPDDEKLEYCIYFKGSERKEKKIPKLPSEVELKILLNCLIEKIRE